jgi:geranylgeranyl diphosphate synthase type II
MRTRRDAGFDNSGPADRLADVTAPDRLESALRRALSRLTGPATPPRLASALDHAVFPGGARVRPHLVLAVAQACGDRNRRAAIASAVAIELLHCASLVHDDLPCFDDADIRRGRPSVHAAFGEELAVLVGDALIVGAFDVLGSGCAHTPRLLASLIREIAAGVGSAGGIVAGQGWESEPKVDLHAYHRTKTAALFGAATRAGALASGADAQPWTELGLRLGEAYQIADDIADAIGREAAVGKPVGRDRALGRPNAVHCLGAMAARARLDAVRRSIAASIPAGIDAAPLVAELESMCARLMPLLALDAPNAESSVTAA